MTIYPGVEASLDSTDLDPDRTGLMTTNPSGTDTLHQPGAPSAQPTPSTTVPRAPLGPTLALTVTLGIACFAVVVAVVVLLVAPKPVGGLPLAQRQDAETALYFAGFALILPVALIAVPRLADAIAAGPNAGALSLLVAFLAATMTASLIVARVLPGASAIDVLGVLGIWWAGAVALLVRARQERPWAPLLRVVHLAPFAWVLAGALALGTLLAFTSLGSISPVPLALGAIAVPAGLAGYRRRGVVRLPRLPRGWGLSIDAAIVVVLLLAIPDLVIFRPEGAASDPLAAFKASVIQFHQDFLLGPANQVLAGDAVLVHTASQYGVAPLYLLTGWFQLVPIGYGTLGFLDGILYALLFAAGYCVLRLAGTSRLLAAGTLALAVIALLYNLLYPVGGLLQHGPLRFGLPMVVILAATVEARWPRHSRGARATQLLVVGLSAIWALEAFAYTVVTFAGIVCFQAWSRPGPGRLRWLARRAALALAACVAAHLIFAAATLAFAGQLPDWGQYFAYLHVLLVGKLADITYDFSPWSPGLPVGAAYAASAAAFVLVVGRSREIVERERTSLTALAGITAYGIALFTYFVNRSADDILPYVSFPAILAGTLWLSLLLRGALVESRSVRLGGLAFALSLAVLLLSTAWSSIGERFPQTALAHALPGDGSLGGAMTRLWHPPPIDPRAPQGEYLLDRYMPGERRVPILVSSDLGTEILMRSGRANELPFGDPVEDFFVGSPHPPAIHRAVAELESGDRLLMQGSGLQILAALKRQPSRDLLTNPVSVPDTLTLEQEEILIRIGERFKLRVIHQDRQRFVVVTLEPRR